MKLVEHLRAEAKALGEVAWRWFRRGFFVTTGLSVGIFALMIGQVVAEGSPLWRDPTAPLGVLVLLVNAVIYGLIGGGLAAIVAGLLHVAGPWFIPPLVVSPLFGGGLVYLARETIQDGTTAAIVWAFGIGGADRTGVIAGPVIVFVGAVSLVALAALFFAIGALVGLFVTTPPLLIGITRRLRDRARQRAPG